MSVGWIKSRGKSTRADHTTRGMECESIMNVMVQFKVWQWLTERATRMNCAVGPIDLDNATAVDRPNPRLAPVMMTVVVAILQQDALVHRNVNFKFVLTLLDITSKVKDVNHINPSTSNNGSFHLVASMLLLIK